MVTKETLDFLKKLQKNNDRDWFTKNKRLFENANHNIVALTDHLISQFAKFDQEVAGLDPKACVFRIYRDVRFSKDKSPYKTNLGAYISPGGRKSMRPGYYIHLQPGNSFMAGGKHLPDGPECLKIRTSIADNTAEFLKIVEKKSFREAFGQLNGERLRSVPKGFDPEHKASEYLKLKEFMAFTEFRDDKFVIDPEFPKVLVKLAREMFPLVAFLRRALA